MRSLAAPLGFSMVEEGIYRSSYPSTRTLPFISTLGLKSMICVNPRDIRDDLKEYCATNKITLLKCEIGINQEPFLVMSERAMIEAVSYATDEELQPTLIFCNNGRVKTSCTVACIRKHLGWSLTSIFHEFETYAEPEGGLTDFCFIENFKIR